MPNFTLGLFAIETVFYPFTFLVLGEVVKYSSVTVSPGKFVQCQSFRNVGTPSTCAAVDHRYILHDKTSTQGYVDIGAQVSDDGADSIKVYSGAKDASLRNGFSMTS